MTVNNTYAQRTDTELLGTVKISLIEHGYVTLCCCCRIAVKCFRSRECFVSTDMKISALFREVLKVLIIREAGVY